MHRHCGTNNRAPRWTFTESCKPEVRPGALNVNVPSHYNVSVHTRSLTEITVNNSARISALNISKLIYFIICHLSKIINMLNEIQIKLIFRQGILISDI